MCIRDRPRRPTEHREDEQHRKPKEGHEEGKTTDRRGDAAGPHPGHLDGPGDATAQPHRGGLRLGRGHHRVTRGPHRGLGRGRDDGDLRAAEEGRVLARCCVIGEHRGPSFEHAHRLRVPVDRAGRGEVLAPAHPGLKEVGLSLIHI